LSLLNVINACGKKPALGSYVERKEKKNLKMMHKKAKT